MAIYAFDGTRTEDEIAGSAGSACSVTSAQTLACAPFTREDRGRSRAALPGPDPDSELAEDRRDLVLHRALGFVDARGNLSVAVTAGHEAEYIELLFR